MKNYSKLSAFSSLFFFILVTHSITEICSLHPPKQELDDRKRIKFGPIRSPFVTDLEGNNKIAKRQLQQNEEAEGIGDDGEEEEENDDIQRSRTNVLYFFISSFANASDNLKTLVNFLLTSNQLILVGWIVFIISIFVLSYLITINPIGNSSYTSPSLPSSVCKDECEEEVVEDIKKGEESRNPPSYLASWFRERLDRALYELISSQTQLNVKILEKENVVANFNELSIDYLLPEQNVVINAEAQDFERHFLFENHETCTIKGIKFTIESINGCLWHYAFKVPYGGIELSIHNRVGTIVQSTPLHIDISEEMEVYYTCPYRQKSLLTRNNRDLLTIDVLKLTKSQSESESLNISLQLDEPSPQILLTNVSPFKTTDSDFIWNSQFIFAINPSKSKQLLIEVRKEIEGEVIGISSICTSDLHLIPSQNHVIPLLHPQKSSPNQSFLSVQLSFNSSSTLSKSIQNAQEEGFYVHKMLETTLAAYQFTCKTSYQRRRIKIKGHSVLSNSVEEGSKASMIVNAALYNLLGITSCEAKNIPFRSTMLITSVQKFPSNRVTEIPDIPSQIPTVSPQNSNLNGFEEDASKTKYSEKENDEEPPSETELSIESISSSPVSEKKKRVKPSSSKSNHSNLFTIPSPIKKSKENFISSLKRIISGPSLYSLDVYSPRPRGRLYSSPSRLGKKNTHIIFISVIKIIESSDNGYSSHSDSEFSLELKSVWKGPRSLSWESWDSGASYLLLPGEGDGSSMSDTREYGLLRHYLIPHKKGGTRLGKRQGSKIHVFNNHLFIAKHIKGGTICSVCKKRIIMRLGKQGYVCRDCGKICHKRCHEKAEEICIKSTFPSMELFRGSTIMKKKDK
ncbi:unnamed protein product [Lepeophtheirus salmonis]|uniref:(salmon louse) hypothetical protein n=1 Tax=Lepeophtheirus salmonis TaxID=72036 RepID=A0A7R8H9K7_LEPSM|nr:unnamed protein product [Lepeophtheirus salmonis]CAF2960314.1 unnamed protein product [Lepeophtheirus salmonis]